MGAALKKMLMGLAGSKKFGIMIVGILSTLMVHKLGFDEAMATEVSTQIVGLAAAALVGQGVADLGKEKAKIEAGGE